MWVAEPNQGVAPILAWPHHNVSAIERDKGRSNRIDADLRELGSQCHDALVRAQQVTQQLQQRRRPCPFSKRHRQRGCASGEQALQLSPRLRIGGLVVRQVELPALWVMQLTERILQKSLLQLGGDRFAEATAQRRLALLRPAFPGDNHDGSVAHRPAPRETRRMAAPARAAPSRLPETFDLPPRRRR